MEPKPLSLSDGRKLAALRAVDVFHSWSSLDEERVCRRCGQRFTGRAIRVYPGRPRVGKYRLECPTDGCPAVPIEWLAVEPEPPSLSTRMEIDPVGGAVAGRASSRGRLGFLRMSRFFRSGQRVA